MKESPLCQGKTPNQSQTFVDKVYKIGHKMNKYHPLPIRVIDNKVVTGVVFRCVLFKFSRNPNPSSTEKVGVFVIDHL